MKNDFKPYVFGIITGAIVMIIVALFLKLSTIITLVSGIVVGAIATVILLARSRGEKPKEVAKEVVQQVLNPDPDALKHRVEEQLMRLNENLRLNCTIEPVITASEEVIDLLFEVVPRALSESPNSEVTFNLEKLATDYVGNLLGNYFELSSDDQTSQQEGLLKQLKDLAEIIRGAKASLDEGNLDDFQIASSFLKAKTA